MKKYKLQYSKTSTGHLLRVTVPRVICDSFGWDRNTILTWEILGKDKLKLERVKNTPPENDRGVI